MIKRVRSMNLEPVQKASKIKGCLRQSQLIWTVVSTS